MAGIDERPSKLASRGRQAADIARARIYVCVPGTVRATIARLATGI
jgi:hypothetical protein